MCVFIEILRKQLKVSEAKNTLSSKYFDVVQYGRMDRPGVVWVLNLPMWCVSVDSCNFSALISFTAAQ